jgi:AcrR family transcriptional regulator
MTADSFMMVISDPRVKNQPMARTADPQARQSMVSAARAVFAKSGLALARIEDITRRCGLSKGSFYLHFASKEALFSEVVAALETQVDTLFEKRNEAYQVLGGSRKSRIAKGRALLTLDAEEDLALLELLWSWRDVLQILTSGCGGTPFEGVMVNMLEAEVLRVKTQCESLKKWGLIPSHADLELMGTMVVGTYFLLIRKLASSSKKPDFAHWVTGLQNLMLHGFYLKMPGAPKRQKRTRSNNV